MVKLCLPLPGIEELSQNCSGSNCQGSGPVEEKQEQGCADGLYNGWLEEEEEEEERSLFTSLEEPFEGRRCFLSLHWEPDKNFNSKQPGHDSHSKLQPVGTVRTQ